MVIAATPEGFDGDINQPGTQKAVVQVYEGITRYGRTTDSEGRVILDSSKIEGHLAESWTVSPDGKKVVFKLREGVKSPFGNALVELGQVANKNVRAILSRAWASRRSTPRAPWRGRAPSSSRHTPSIYDTTETKKHATADDPFAEK